MRRHERDEGGGADGPVVLHGASLRLKNALKCE
jgi:hypothetical protein